MLDLGDGCLVLGIGFVHVYWLCVCVCVCDEYVNWLWVICSDYL